MGDGDLVAAACSPVEIERVQEIMRRAFAILGGYRDAYNILMGINYNLIDQIGRESEPMKSVVPAAYAGLRAAGRDRQALEALFKKLPGNAELRDWIRTNTPDLIVLVSEAEFASARDAYDTERLQRRVGGITSTLGAIEQEIALPEEQKQLVRDIISRIDDLNAFKMIHDALHRLRMMTLVEYYRIANPEMDEQERVDVFRLQGENIEDARDVVLGQFSNAALNSRERRERDFVASKLASIIAMTNTGSPTPDLATAAANILRGELREQMSLFDSRLVDVSETIPFDALANALRDRARNVDGGQGSPLGERLVSVGDAFADLRARLQMRRTVHRLWQQVESTLLNIEELLSNKSGRGELELRIHWQNLEDLLNEIAREARSDDVPALLTAPGLELAVVGTSADIHSPAFLRPFAVFSQMARARFQRADTALRNDSGQLKYLAAPLQNLL